VFYEYVAKGAVTLVSVVPFSVFKSDEDVVNKTALPLTGISAIKT
jgi:hypothetical protein